MVRRMVGFSGLSQLVEQWQSPPQQLHSMLAQKGAETEHTSTRHLGLLGCWAGSADRPVGRMNNLVPWSVGEAEGTRSQGGREVRQGWQARQIGRQGWQRAGRRRKVSSKRTPGHM